jgi:hypothetical protein
MIPIISLFFFIRHLLSFVELISTAPAGLPNPAGMAWIWSEVGRLFF